MRENSLFTKIKKFVGWKEGVLKLRGSKRMVGCGRL